MDGKYAINGRITRNQIVATVSFNGTVFKFPGIQLRKTSLKSTPQAQENGTTTKENTFVRPQLRPVPQKEASKPPKENRVPINLKKIEDRPRESIAPVVTEPRRTSLTRMVSKDDPGEIDKVSNLNLLIGSTFRLLRLQNLSRNCSIEKGSEDDDSGRNVRNTMEAQNSSIK